MATNDVLSALRQGVVDGAENNIVFYAAEQHYSEAPYFSWTRHQQSIDVLLASKRWLDDQPAAHRDAIVAAGQQAQRQELELWATATDTQLAAATQHGAETNEVDVAAFRRAVQPVLDEHRGTFGDLTALLPQY